jgi:DNA-binding HxlR family transcriptional regulator
MQFRPAVFHPARFVILKALAGDMSVDFLDLRQVLGNMASGNLASHLRALQKENYITFRKLVDGRKVRTVYSLTPMGLREYLELRDTLSEWTKYGQR